MSTPALLNSFSPKRPSGCRHSYKKSGRFYRKSDHTFHQRYRCKVCGQTYSDASSSPAFGQKKRHLNGLVLELLSSNMSQRRFALNLRASRTTVVRKFQFVAKHAELFLKGDLQNHEPAKEIEFDELVTFEHSKMKPLTVSAVVESKTRRVLGLKVAVMPANGLLAKKSRAKYGKRKSERLQKLDSLISDLKPFISPNAVFKSDQDVLYPRVVKKHFPDAKHQTFKGRRGCVVGQGELKAGGFDPLFSLNHTFAMFRANVNRLNRRTWNTTKKRERLEAHLNMYALFHNWKLLKPKIQKGEREMFLKLITK